MNHTSARLSKHRPKEAMNEHLHLSSSQARFLEELSDEVFWKYAQEAAHVTTHPVPVQDEYLLCELSSGCYLIPLVMLQEVVPTPQHYTVLPTTPQWVRGLLAWRGDIIVAIDLDAYLCSADEPHPLQDGAMLLIAQYEHYTIGFYVPSLGTTVMIDATQLHVPEPGNEHPLPTIQSVLLGSYEQAWVIDIQAILTTIVQRIEVLAL